MFLGATDEMLAAEDIKWVDAERKNQYWEVGASSTLHSTPLSIARPTLSARPTCVTPDLSRPAHPPLHFHRWASTR